MTAPNATPTMLAILEVFLLPTGTSDGSALATEPVGAFTDGDLVVFAVGFEVEVVAVVLSLRHEVLETATVNTPDEYISTPVAFPAKI